MTTNMLPKQTNLPRSEDKPTTDTTTNTPFFADPVKVDKPVAKHVKHVNPIFNDDKHVAKADKSTKEDKPATDTTTNTPFFADPVKVDKPVAKHVKHVNPIFNDFNPVFKQDNHIDNKLTDNNNQGRMNKDSSNSLAENIIAQVNQNLRDAGINMG